MALLIRLLHSVLLILCNAGSLEMEKLRQAVMGQNGRNLDDLDHMDGMQALIFV